MKMFKIINNRIRLISENDYNHVSDSKIEIKYMVLILQNHFSFNIAY